MKNALLLLAGAAALSLASCSQEKTTEVTTVPVATDGTATTTTTTTTSAPLSDSQIEARAQQIADKMVANMKITDEATKAKIRTVYVNRYKRLNETRTKYATDTTGMAAALREANTATDVEFKTVFVDPTQYQAYEASRSTYDERNYTNDNASVPDNAAATEAPASGSNSGSGNANPMDAGAGGKVKVQADGDIKIKDAAGNKTKIDGDDGTVKIKPKDGEKIKMK